MLEIFISRLQEVDTRKGYFDLGIDLCGSLQECYEKKENRSTRLAAVVRIINAILFCFLVASRDTKTNDFKVTALATVELLEDLLKNIKELN